MKRPKKKQMLMEEAGEICMYTKTYYGIVTPCLLFLRAICDMILCKHQLYKK